MQNLSYEVRSGEALAIVGESGSGKSVSSLAVMGLLPTTATISGGIDFMGQDMFALSDRQLSKLRGDKISMIFQDPLSALTPVYTIGDQIAEAIQLHHPNVSKAAAADRAIELLESVGITEARRRARQFPHEFSGGMRQRAMIAMAIANEPELIIADEPTTALDVTIQAQVLELLKTAQEMVDAATILITHDLGVVAGFADRVLVMEKSFRWSSRGRSMTSSTAPVRRTPRICSPRSRAWTVRPPLLSASRSSAANGGLRGQRCGRHRARAR